MRRRAIREMEDAVASDPQDNPVQFWIIYLAILGVVLFIGWKQPLRYRFMSKAQIDAVEHPPTPTPRPVAARPAPTPSQLWAPNRKGALDR